MEGGGDGIHEHGQLEMLQPHEEVCADPCPTRWRWPALCCVQIVPRPRFDQDGHQGAGQTGAQTEEEVDVGLDGTRIGFERFLREGGHGLVRVPRDGQLLGDVKQGLGSDLCSIWFEILVRLDQEGRDGRREQPCLAKKWVTFSALSNTGTTHENKGRIHVVFPFLHHSSIVLLRLVDIHRPNTCRLS